MLNNVKIINVCIIKTYITEINCMITVKVWEGCHHYYTVYSVSINEMKPQWFVHAADNSIMLLTNVIIMTVKKLLIMLRGSNYADDYSGNDILMSGMLTGYGDNENADNTHVKEYNINNEVKCQSRVTSY